MSEKRRICVVTGARAEYGLLYWLLQELKEAQDVELQIVVTGMHLSPEFGSTWRVIEDDGFDVAAKVDMLLSGDSPTAIAKSTGLGVIGFADAFERLRPDIVVLLGDRFEILAAAQAAMLARIPIAHLHGGESSEGAVDEAIRHAVTKMAHLHFVAAEPYRRRVIQMGEQPGRVFNTGAPGLDHLERMNWLSRTDLERELGMRCGRPLFLVTYHPATLESYSPAEPMRELLAALGEFPEASIVLTYPNADARGRVLIKMIDEYVKSHPDSARAFASLGQRVYLSVMRECDVVIGNSSSGLTEAPALHRASVNIGNRQRGRLKAASVIDCIEQRAAITAAIVRALSADFRSHLPAVESLYQRGNASTTIARLLRTTPLAGLLDKAFYTP